MTKNRPFSTKNRLFRLKNRLFRTKNRLFRLKNGLFSAKSSILRTGSDFLSPAHFLTGSWPESEKAEAEVAIRRHFRPERRQDAGAVGEAEAFVRHGESAAPPCHDGEGEEEAGGGGGGQDDGAEAARGAGATAQEGDGGEDVTGGDQGAAAEAAGAPVVAAGREAPAVPTAQEGAARGGETEAQGAERPDDADGGRVPAGIGAQRGTRPKHAGQPWGSRPGWDPTGNGAGQADVWGRHQHSSLWGLWGGAVPGGSGRSPPPRPLRCGAESVRGRAAGGVHGTADTGPRPIHGAAVPPPAATRGRLWDPWGVPSPHRFPAPQQQPPPAEAIGARQPAVRLQRRRSAQPPAAAQRPIAHRGEGGAALPPRPPSLPREFPAPRSQRAATPWVRFPSRCPPPPPPVTLRSCPTPPRGSASTTSDDVTSCSSRNDDVTSAGNQRPIRPHFRFVPHR